MKIKLSLIFILALIAQISFAQNKAIHPTGKIAQFMAPQDTTKFVRLIGNQSISGTKQFDTLLASSDVTINSLRVGRGNTNLGNIILGDNNNLYQSTGTQNLSIGTTSMTNNTTGNNNLAIGASTLYSNTTGNQNVAVGAGALQLNSTGSANVGIGYYSLYSNTGSYNIAIGNLGQFSKASGNYNISIGNNQEVGSGSGYTTNNTLNIGGAIFGTGLTGNWGSPAGKIGIGKNNPSSTLDVNGNIMANDTIFANSFVKPSGTSTDVLMTDGSTKKYSIYDGFRYDNAIASTQQGVGINTQTPSALLEINGTGYLANQIFKLQSSSDVALHMNSPASTWQGITLNRSGVEQWFIGMSNQNNHLYFKSANTTQNIGIGATSPTEKLQVNGNMICLNALAGAYGLLSDIRLKKNFLPINHALKTIQQLKPYEYDKKSNIDSSNYDSHEFGFIAQDVQKIMPFLIAKGKDKHQTLSLNYTALIPLMSKAIQELNQELNQKNKLIQELNAQFVSQNPEHFYLLMITFPKLNRPISFPLPVIKCYI